jgi:hypothetical protein
VSTGGADCHQASLPLFWHASARAMIKDFNHIDTTDPEGRHLIPPRINDLFGTSPFGLPTDFREASLR